LIPFEPRIGNFTLNVHLVLEYVAFFVAYRYYIFLRKRRGDTIPQSNRLSIILGAALGAFVGSRFIGLLENPMADFAAYTWLDFYNVKTITGGLFGGLLGVEAMKWRIGEKQSSGDLFTLPIILGIFIGRIGCFLSGTNEFTYGNASSFIMAMDLGDGIRRHPLALYEMIFLTLLFITLQYQYRQRTFRDGVIFKVFMLSYFAFRFAIEFIKPNVFLAAGLSTIQWLCIIVFLYYWKTIYKIVTPKLPGRVLQRPTH
jgi:phosphatidylglycerol---prolipoprotein diacylglyceryl transferase